MYRIKEVGTVNKELSMLEKINANFILYFYKKIVYCKINKVIKIRLDILIRFFNIFLLNFNQTYEGKKMYFKL